MIPLGRVAIVSHDAGGAEILSSFLNQEKISYILCLKGPALKIFQRKLGVIQNHLFEEVIMKCDWVLTGTSWGSDLEYRAICLAKNMGKFVVSFLDHWVNYLERFIWHGPERFPDEIWVADIDAKILAEKTFGDIKIKLIANPYLLDIKKKYQSMNKKTNSKKDIYLLYVSSNIDGIKNKKKVIKYSDNDVFKIFYNNILNIIDKKRIKKILFRPHPSEDKVKYDFSNLGSIPITFDQNNDLIDSVIKTTHVAGHNSMALVVSKICGLRTINIINNLPCDPQIPRRYVDYYL